MKMPLERATKISFVVLVLFAIFVTVAFLNIFLKNLPVVISASVLIIAVALTMLLLGDIEGFLIFMSMLVIAGLFIITFDIQFTFVSAAIIIGILVVFITFIS